jgi:O-antigen/teichoic acid export membrane protein
MNEHFSTFLSISERYLRTDIRYLARGMTWTGIGQGFALSLSLVSAIAFANLLPKEIYGTYKYILGIATLLAIPGLLAMTTAVTQAVARGHAGVYLPAMKAKLRWGSLGAVGSLCIGGYYTFLEANSMLATTFFVLAPLIPLAESLSLWNAVQGGKKRFRDAAIDNILTQGGVAITMIVAIVLTDNVAILAGAYFAATIVFRYCAHRKMMRRYPELSHESDPDGTVRFGKNLSLINVFTTLTGQLDTLLLFHLLGPTALAGYAFAIATTYPVKSLMKSIVFLATPKFAMKPTKEIRDTINKKVFRAFLLLVPAVAAYILLLPLAYRLLFPQYLETVHYAQALGLMFLFFPLKLYSVAVVTRENEHRMTYALNILNTAIGAISFLLLIPILGVWGGIIAILVDQILTATTTFIAFKRLRSDQ